MKTLLAALARLVDLVAALRLVPALVPERARERPRARKARSSLVLPR